MALGCICTRFAHHGVDLADRRLLARSYCSQKWSKGKVKEKLANLVLFDKITYEKLFSDVPKQRLITPSIISEKLKDGYSFEKPCQGPDQGHPYS